MLGMAKEAVVMGYDAVMDGDASKVEAGEKLGFLPGDLAQKVDPYLRPLYDALFDMLGAETYQKYLERGNIEVAPLAYMRGRTLDDSFIILDEAQNTTCEPSSKARWMAASVRGEIFFSLLSTVPSMSTARIR